MPQAPTTDTARNAAMVNDRANDGLLSNSMKRHVAAQVFRR
jgi:hypothetical protein